MVVLIQCARTKSREGDVRSDARSAKSGDGKDKEVAEKRASLKGNKGAATEVWVMLSRTVSVAVALVCAYTFNHCVDSLFKMKSGWNFDTPFFPPGHFKTGSVRNDQGISF